LSGALEKTLQVDGQKMHSTVAVIKEADITGGNAGEAELDNPLIKSFRPAVAVQSDGTDNDTELATKAKLAAELRAIKLTIKLDSWLVNDKVIFPNTVISIKDPNLFLYEKTNFFVEAVTLSGNEKAQLATLECVLPEVYTYKLPKNLFS